MTKIKVEYTAPVPHMYTPPDIFMATLSSNIGIRVIDGYFEPIHWSDPCSQWRPFSLHKGDMSMSELSLLVEAYNNRGDTSND